MPELPEVHTTATMLHKLLRGLRIIFVWTNYYSQSHKGKDNIKDPKFFRRFARKISGACFRKIYRRGKNVLLELDNGQTIIVHMKMTGHLLYGAYKKISNFQFPISKKTKIGKKKEGWVAVKKGPLQDSKNQFIRFVISLSDGKHLALSDMRRFAKITIAPTDKLSESEHLKNLGSEPLEKNFTLPRFRERLMTKPHGKIKQVLMNPEVIAGVGNIYSDEILYEAGVHPLTVVAKLPGKVFPKLYRATAAIQLLIIETHSGFTARFIITTKPTEIPENLVRKKVAEEQYEKSSLAGVALTFAIRIRMYIDTNFAIIRIFVFGYSLIRICSYN